MRRLEMYTFKWFAFWMLCMGFATFLSATLDINHYSHSTFSGIYYLFFAGIGIYYFDHKEQLYNLSNLRYQTLIISALLISYILLTTSIEYTFPLDSEFKEKILLSKLYFSLFEFKVNVSKITDIIFQQVLLSVLILNLKKDGVKKDTIIKVFTFVFGLIHFPLAYLYGWNGFLYFFIPSVLTGGVFAYILLNYKFGLSYNFALHLLFYVMLGQLMRNVSILYV